MAWNKVRARIKYKSGVYTSYALADSSVRVGDIVRCVVASGYETECTIVEICKEDVKYTKDHAKVLGTTQPISKEDKSVMMDEIFVTVFVEDGRGYNKRCRALGLFEKDTLVAYEGTDGRYHVASVAYCVPAGVPYESAKGVDTAGFIAYAIDTQMVDKCKNIEKEYQATLSQLKARKKMFEERAIWEMLAEKDPEAKELLGKLDGLKGGNLRW